MPATAATPGPTRARLLQAAAQVFLEHGLAAASMDQVRLAAGVSNGSLYHHFPTKAALADALYAHTLRDFHAVIAQPLSARASAQSGVKGMLRAYVAWVVANPAGARLLHELKRQGNLAATDGEWSQANAQGFALLGDWVARKTQAGEMRALPFPVWMALVFSPAMALTRQWVQQDPPAVPAQVRSALEHAAWVAVAP